MTEMNVESFRDLVFIYAVSVLETSFRSSAELRVFRELVYFMSLQHLRLYHLHLSS